MDIYQILFYAIVALTIFSAAIVAFSNKIIYSAFALLLTLFGFAALYVYLSADFLAVTQVLIYVGGILVLILFGVLMTQKVYDLSALTTHNSFWISMAGAGSLALILGLVIYKAPWISGVDKPFQPTTATIGNAILAEYLLPFEIASLLLLGALIGAVYIARTEDHK
ncbi:MAG: NADH-quinone oxidoreductase subunit J [Calditrichaceae bacterium]